MPLTNGDRFAGFTITEFLGSGASGASYLAVEATSHQPARLKILHAGRTSDPGFRQQFRQTNEKLMRLDTPTIARVLDYGEHGGRLWVATEFVTGTSAVQLLLRRFPSGVPHRSLCVIVDHAAFALDEAARAGLVHGAVKPTNIVLSKPFSKNYRVALTDFGHRYPGSASSEDPYAAPEVLAGEQPTTHSDQFALAATAFHLLTGEVAFPNGGRRVSTTGRTDFNTQAMHNPAITVDGLDRVFARALAADPAARFDTCSEFVDAFVSPPAPAEAVATSARATESKAQPAMRSVLFPAAAAVVVAVALTVAAVVLSRPESGRQTTGAPLESALVSTAAAPAPPCQKLDEALAKLNLRQRLAQTLMVGVTDIDDARAVVNDQGVGGIFVASWTDLSMLRSGALRELQSAPRPIPLAVSVDEEGGRVQRLKSLLTYQDSPRQLVAEGTSVQQVHDIAFERGRKMREFGITIDFAPVVDVTSAADNTVIGDRSFSNDPETMTEYAGAYAQGLRDAGLLPVLKHFPGHGRASGDSHESGVVTPPLDDLMQKDLIPYRTLTVPRPVAVMLGHMQVPGLTGSDPASLSAPAYSLLRQGDYGGPAFDGPVFTDDLSSMGAINQRYSVPDAVVKALRAGADTALWISTDEVPAVLDRLEGAVNTGELDAGRIDDAVRRMAVTKDPELACTR